VPSRYLDDSLAILGGRATSVSPAAPRSSHLDRSLQLLGGQGAEEDEPSLFSKGLGAITSVLGAPKAATDYLARKSASALGIPEREGETVGQMLRAGVGLDPSEADSYAGRAAGKLTEFAGDLLDPTLPVSFGGGTAGRIAAGALGTVMGASALQEGARTLETLNKEGFTPEAAEDALGTVLGAGGAALLGRQALKRPKGAGSVGAGADVPATPEAQPFAVTGSEYARPDLDFDFPSDPMAAFGRSPVSGTAPAVRLPEPTPVDVAPPIAPEPAASPLKAADAREAGLIADRIPAESFDQLRARLRLYERRLMLDSAETVRQELARRSGGAAVEPTAPALAPEPMAPEIVAPEPIPEVLAEAKPIPEAGRSVTDLTVPEPPAPTVERLIREGYPPEEAQAAALEFETVRQAERMAELRAAAPEPAQVGAIAEAVTDVPPINQEVIPTPERLPESTFNPDATQPIPFNPDVTQPIPRVTMLRGQLPEPGNVKPATIFQPETRVPEGAISAKAAEGIPAQVEAIRESGVTDFPLVRPEARKLIFDGDAALARLKARGQQAKAGGGLSFLEEGAGALKDVATYGASLIERGVRDFAAWSKEMVARMGQEIEPHLRALYDHALDLTRRAMGNENKYRVFHGTKGEFGGFDLKQAGKSDPGLLGSALYFTPNEAQARSFAESPHYGSGGGAPRVVAADVELKNPLVIEDGRLPDGRTLSDLHPNGITPDSAAKINAELKSAGHDGAVFKIGGEVSQVVAFDPASAKVARSSERGAVSMDFLLGPLVEKIQKARQPKPIKPIPDRSAKPPVPPPAVQPPPPSTPRGQAPQGGQPRKPQTESLREIPENPTLPDMFIEGWKSGLVSSPGSLLVANPGSNIAEAGFRAGEAGVAGWVDQILTSIHGGPRTRFSGEALAQVKGGLSKLPQAGAALADGLKSVLKSEGAIPGKAGGVIRAPLQLLEIGDRVTAEPNKGAAIAALAHRQARKQMPKGSPAEVAALEKRLAENPTPEMVTAAEKEVRDRQFKSDDNPDSLIKKLVKFRSEHKWMHAVFPFLETPVRIADLTLQRSPAGFVKAAKAYSAYRKAVKLGAEPAVIERLKGEAVDKITRPLVGSVVLGTFGVLAKSGLMTGSGPADSRQKGLLKETGWQPYSFKIPNGKGGFTYVPFNRFEPASGLLGFAADLAEAGNAKDANDVFEKALASVTQNLTSKTYLQGLADAAGLIKDPSQFAGQYASNMAGSLVPGVVAKAAQAIDPTIRDTRPEESGFVGLPERMGKSVMARIPGVSQMLPERRSGTGEAIKRPGEGVAGAVSRFASPIQVTSSKAGKELEELLVKLEAVPSAPRNEITANGRKVRLTAEDIKEIQDNDQKATDYLRTIVRTPRFRAMSEEDQKKTIEQTYSRFRSQGRKRVLTSSSFRRRAREATA
jgi:hypothetical protein